MHTPPWHIFNYIHVCEQLYTERKSELDPTSFRSIFEDDFRLHINDTFVFTDGSRTNSGVAYAYVGQNVNVYRCIQPFLAIFTAELLAIQDGLLYCLSQENGNITMH